MPATKAANSFEPAQNEQLEQLFFQAPICLLAHPPAMAALAGQNEIDRREKRLKRPEKGYLFDFAHWLNGSERLG